MHVNNPVIKKYSFNQALIHFVDGVLYSQVEPRDINNIKDGSVYYLS